MKTYIINGAPQSGKTLFENYIHMRADTPVFIYSTVSLVKALAKKAGWSGEKTPKDRKFLSDLKDLLTEWGDVPFKTTVEYHNYLQRNFPNSILFIDCREPEEIDRLKNELKAKTICIRRFEMENTETSNHADANILDYTYDEYIYNNNSIESYQEDIEFFMKREEIK